MKKELFKLGDYTFRNYGWNDRYGNYNDFFMMSMIF
jgi:hypothetical protein